MNPNLFLQIAYAANILILVPVCASMFLTAGGGNVFAGIVPESAGLRLMVASLWLAILLASLTGLFLPRFFAPVLLIQIVYKSVWLAVFVAPLVMQGKPWPSGIAICFLLIVTSYPIFFWLGYVRA